MTFSVGNVVRALNGRDSDLEFFVVGLNGDYALIADGKGRRLEKPKKKKLKHLQFVAQGKCPASEKLRSGEKATNNELRRSLRKNNEPDREEQGGM
jgi:ribosomal protein L14E/L6E/L27E